MKDWTEGYMAAIDYTHGFYRELTPLLLAFTALAKGVRAPIQDADLHYCELGCGQGLSTNILAAANPHIQFYATDFNPAQIAGATRLAQDANSRNVHFYDTSFEDFVHEPTLPEQFDVITLHGIYSWVSEENRAYIVDFIKKKLRPGGVVYISYNTLPGWAGAMPMRQLMADHINRNSGAVSDRIDAALRFAHELKNLNAQYFVDHPSLNDRLSKMETMPRNYLAHEYFNKDWTPFYFSEVASELDQAKLSFVGSAHILDQIEYINLSSDQLQFLAKETDPIRSQSLRDILVNQQFRRDIFCKGIENYSVPDSRAAWMDMRFTLTYRREDVPLNINTRLGEISLQEDIYGPILDGFMKGPATLRDLLKNQSVVELGWAKLQQALLILVGTGSLEPCLQPKNEKKRRERTNAFNSVLLQKAIGSGDITFLASPVTGGGVRVSRFEQLYLNARSKGKKEPSEWVDFAWQVLKEQNQKLLKDGAPIESEEENIAELTRQAIEFKEKKLPVLMMLQIA